MQSTSKNGIKKDLLSILSQKNTREETEFLKNLISYMESRHTPIERPPMLGYKQSKYRIFSIRSRPRLEAAVFFDVGEIQAALYY